MKKVSIKKIFGSQSSSQGSSQSSSQKTKVHFVKQKNETDHNDTESENLTISEIEECDDTTELTQDSCYSWSSVSQEIDIKGKKRELSDDKEEPWWESLNHNQLKNHHNQHKCKNSKVHEENQRQRLVHHKMTIKVMMKTKEKEKLAFT